MSVIEAARGDSVDMLILCGFAFDPTVSEESCSYGRLVVQTARINPDLLMGKDLKKDGKGSLFTVFGEPDIHIQRESDGRLVVTLLGWNIADPTDLEPLVKRLGAWPVLISPCNLRVSLKRFSEICYILENMSTG